MTPTPPPTAPEPLKALMELIQILRGPDGCPWDRQQTPRSIALYLIEELYELVDAIESERAENICEELGDVLFQVFFIADLLRESDDVGIEEVARRSIEKMVGRHAHVFGSDRLEDPAAVRERWHQIKRREKGPAAEPPVGDSVPLRLPALMRAYRISERAARRGFDWRDVSGVMEKVEEEWAEFKSAQKAQLHERAATELGDVFFTLTNVARFVNIHPETALTGAVKKFEHRFKELEKRAAAEGVGMESARQRDLDRIWEQIKAEEHG